MTKNKRILLIISGGIAAYKTLDLIRRMRECGYSVRAILTKAGAEFVTPLSVSSLTEDKVYGELFSLTDESEMGHIQLSRDADLLVVAPASADLIAKMANGLCNDLASTALLATDKPVMIVPAMNVRMWQHPATQANIKTLSARGVIQVGPAEGAMACGEFGMGRMSEPMEILEAVNRHFQIVSISKQHSDINKKALVTSGPTHEPIDPVRYIANRSSGRQGHAIAAALAARGIETTLVSGPTDLPDPKGVNVIRVESAEQMLSACNDQLPIDVAICAAAVADWRVKDAGSQKMKKETGGLPTLELVENPDILHAISSRKKQRPDLVVGFAAETENVVKNATAKRLRKGCDWILANDVSIGTGTFGGEKNAIHFITDDGCEDWPHMTKQAVAERLVDSIVSHFSVPGKDKNSEAAE
ncbi:bifunctional phosphopantothenoylcysteine decarboxylase/phosphopantothenate--cysteine ligase CoaBC [Aestuariispira insulae]|uniref:Coenzyme A biosynthesis bifunctional protein CoaBC n=1 Tax=Aestuariispira insulae TaxID=1461337 RepID=A0A3D9H9R0_9PROT|nr:bifunctional phosphopantothenoylcysteine decarboxylase/phosphopantothenate--cysteine ligase CoaBC [Aestuariispira insulae]RED46222.1 phosphopantothenoylcysteine decarboxylase/phosphopantothenate--cysteine ligase [Aestuariispira insulae]